MTCALVSRVLQLLDLYPLTARRSPLAAIAVRPLELFPSEEIPALQRRSELCQTKLMVSVREVCTWPFLGLLTIPDSDEVRMP